MSGFFPVIRKGDRPVLKQNRYQGVEYLTFPLLEKCGLVNHLFSTRIGGVSEGIYATMNFHFTSGDDIEHVRENYRRIAEIFGSDESKFVCSDQTHTTNVRLVTRQDMGKGVTREIDYTGIDGLITDEPGIILRTSFADCVPLYFVDVKHKAIGLSHSGWRGTVNRMGAVTLKAMERAFGTKPEDVLAAIGPSICADCYEVGRDVAEEFERAFPDAAGRLLTPGRQEGKYQLDLWKANELILLEAGVKKESMEITDICTCCNRDYLFSHRATAGRRGNLCAFMELRNS